MVLRWCAAGMVEASKRFRRVNGHLYMPTLCPALEQHVIPRQVREIRSMSLHPYRPKWSRSLLATPSPSRHELVTAANGWSAPFIAFGLADDEDSTDSVRQTSAQGHRRT